MKTILALLLILPSISSSQIIIANDKDSYPQLIQDDFYINGNIKYKKLFDYEQYSKSEEFKVKEYTEYYKDGQLHLNMKMKNSVLHGSLVAYWKNGKLKRKDLYKNGTLVEGKIWNQNGKETVYSEFKIPLPVREN